MKSLLVISSAAVSPQADGQLLLDNKFLAGMQAYCDRWQGPVSCVVQATGDAPPFGRVVDPAELPFELRVLTRNQTLGAADITPHDVVLCSGDNHRYFHLADICQAGGVRLYYIIEYILETRMQIIRLAPARSWLRKARSVVWTWQQERRRRRAFARAHGLQANGYPAARAYTPINANTLLYLDNRVATSDMATPEDMAARRAHLTQGGPLRLVHSGRLEPMKGSQDLIPIAKQLRDAGVAFQLDIFGTGSLEAAIRDGIAAHGLEHCVTLHGVVDFKTELVPFARTQSDIFLSCHRQSDPSCSYLENMGCGLAVVGYDNRMWAGLAEQSGAGWVAPLGDWNALAQQIKHAASDPAGVADRCDVARRFAGDHSFEAEFDARVRHLAQE